MDNPGKPHDGPRVSVVIPVFNGGADLGRCLEKVGQSDYPVHECLVIDDASTDGMIEPAAKRAGARVIRNDQQCGPANARNRGVKEASGDIIFFIDADVLLHPQAIAVAVGAFRSEPELAAVFGSYDDQPAHESFTSQYRNLFHHWVHQEGANEASTFWTGCGAIRRDIFLDIGGFHDRYRKPSIEDIELGARLKRAGYRIRLLKSMLGTHLKDWRFLNMVKTDIFHRGVPWMELMLNEGKLHADLNLNYKSRLATFLAGLLGLALVSMPLLGHGPAIVPTAVFLLAALACSKLSVRSGAQRLGGPAVLLTALAPVICYGWIGDTLALLPFFLVMAIVATHLPFYRYVASRRNLAFAAAVIPMQVVFFVGCAIAIPIALVKHYLLPGGDEQKR